MKNIEEVKLLLLERKINSFESILNDYDVNSFDSHGNNILHYYVKNFNSINVEAEAWVVFLQEKGLDINAVQSKSPCRSPLHLAIMEENTELTKVLISLNAIVDIMDDEGNTPLAQAVFNYKDNDSFFIKILIANGANKNMQNKHGISPLSLSKMIANYNSAQFFEN